MPRPQLNASFSLGDAMQQTPRHPTAWRTHPSPSTLEVSSALLRAGLELLWFLPCIANTGCTFKSVTAIHGLIAHEGLL